MITENVKNKVDELFPTLLNADANGNTLGSTSELWSVVSERYVDGVRKILAPVKDMILDVQNDLQVRNPDACPVVQVEVVKSVGDALVDATNWNQSAIQNEYVDVKLHRISRPFKLTMYDIMKGERIESKIGAAMNAVAQGVVKQFFSATAGLTNETLTGFDPDTCASLSGAFGADAETDVLILDPENYAKIVPTNGFSLDPNVEGTYGIGKIYKSLIVGAPANTNAIALNRDAIAGAVATPEILVNQPGTSTQYLGEVAGIPMLLMAKFDFDTQTIKCSVETMAGFALTTSDHIKTYTIS